MSGASASLDDLDLGLTNMSSNEDRTDVTFVRRLPSNVTLDPSSVRLSGRVVSGSTASCEDASFPVVCARARSAWQLRT